MSIAEIVKQTRSRERLSLSEMGKALGVARQTVHQWEKGQATPGLSLLLNATKDYSDWRRDFARACLDNHPSLNHRS